MKDEAKSSKEILLEGEICCKSAQELACSARRKELLADLLSRRAEISP